MNEPRDYYNYITMNNELFQKLLGMYSYIMFLYA